MRAPTAAVDVARIRFLATFFVLAVGLVALMHFPYPRGSFPVELTYQYLKAYAHAAGALIHVFDPVVTVAGLEIRGRFQLMIVRSCDAWEAMALVIAAMVAYPARPVRRAVGLAVGVAAVSLVNVIRITSLYFIGASKPELFEVMHASVWPPVLVVVSVAIFVVWARWSQRIEREVVSHPT
jgi:exosortase/archaeosortase family protein